MWDVRPGNRYYYRHQWVGGRPVRVYVGTGPEAEQAAADDQRRRQERQQRLAAQRAVESTWTAVLAEIETVAEWSTLLTQASLTLAGYYQHDRGAWRRKRNGKAANNQATPAH